LATTRCQTLAHHIYSTYHHHPTTQPSSPSPPSPSRVPKWAKRGRSRRHQPPRHHRRQPHTPHHHRRQPRMPRHRRRQPPFPTAHATSPPSTTPNRHVTAVNDPKRHVTAIPPSSSPNRHFTAVDEPQTPRHRSQTPSPCHHGCPSPSQGMWAPKSTTGERGARRIGQGARRQGKGGMRMQGKWVGKGEPFMLPPSPLFVPKANEAA
jgi:hypothetical protein